MGEQLYKDKKVADIQKDIKDDFNKIDSYTTRDDREIYKVGRNTIGKYITEIKKSKESFGPWALEEFTKLDTQLVAEMKKMDAAKFFTNNEAVIKDIANKIDNAEKSVIERLSINRSKTKMLDLKKDIGGKYFTVESDNSILFTNATNKPKIHEVLVQIVKDKKETYIIDYSKCTNQYIKNKMLSLTGTKNGQCYISYDEETKTYQLRDGLGHTLPQRALVWEGVRIIPEFVYKQQAKHKKSSIEKNKIESIKNNSNITDDKTLHDLEKDSHWGPILADLKKLGGDLYEKLEKESKKDPKYLVTFLSESEKRLDEILIYAKQHKWDFHAEPISKLTFGSGLMEVHLVSDTAEKNVTFFADDKKLGKELYDWIDADYESEYLSFLTTRLHKKVDDFVLLDKKEYILQSSIDKNDKSKKYTDQEKENINQGLFLFSTMLKNIKDENGDTWGNDDRKIVDMISFLDNATYSIKDISILTENILKNSIIKPLYDKRNKFSSSKSDIVLLNVFLGGDKDKIREAIRSLGQSLTTLDNTYTSDLKDDIINESNLKLKNNDIDKCFQNISSKLKFNEGDGFEKEPQRALIDSLYMAKGGLDLKNILQSNDLLPSDTLLGDDLEETIEKCTDLYDQLTARQKTADNMAIDIDEFKNNQEVKKNFLEAKENKTEDDLLELQTIVWLENNEAQAGIFMKESLSIVKEQIKYGDMDQLVKGTLGHFLIDMSGGLQSGNGFDMYNDITGQGFWNLSDENVKFVGELGQMILEEVAFTIAVLALTATTGVGGTALVGARIALRTVSVGNKLNKIRGAKRMITVAQKVGKGLARTEKIIKIADKVKDVTKAIKVADKVKDLSKTKNLLTKTTSYLNKLNPIQRKTILADLDKVLTRGFLHQVLAKTYRGELDADTEIWIKDILKSSGMYGVLGVIGRSAKIGNLAKLFANNPSGLKLSQICAEEGLMFGSDMGVDIVMDSSPMPTMQEIAQNVGIGLGAELLPRVGGRIKTMRIGKDYININGKSLTPANLLAEIDVQVKTRKLSKEQSSNSSMKEEYKTSDEIYAKIYQTQSEIDLIKGDGKYAETIDVLENIVRLLKAKKNKNANIEDQINIRETELNLRKQKIFQLENKIADLNLSLKEFHITQISDGLRKASTQGDVLEVVISNKIFFEKKIGKERLDEMMKEYRKDLNKKIEKEEKDALDISLAA